MLNPSVQKLGIFGAGFEQKFIVYAMCDLIYCPLFKGVGGSKKQVASSERSPLAPLGKEGNKKKPHMGLVLVFNLDAKPVRTGIIVNRELNCPLFLTLAPHEKDCRTQRRWINT